MDLLTGYDSSNSESENNNKVETKRLKAENVPAAAGPKSTATSTTSSIQPVARRSDRRFLHAAPAVSAITAGRGTASSQLVNSTSLAVYSGGGGAAKGGRQGNKGAIVLMNNPTKLTLYQPVLGPQLDANTPAFNKSGVHEANVAFDDSTFHEQRNNFQRNGLATAPDAHGTAIARTTLGYNRDRLEIFEQQEEQRRKRPRPDPTRKEKDILVYGSEDEIEHGVWAPPGQEERWATENNLSDVVRLGVDSLAPEQLAEREYLKERDRQRGIQEEAKEQESAVDRLVERKMAHLLPPRLGDDAEPDEATTTFHGKEEIDYKGRSWIAAPSGLSSIVRSEDDLEMDHHKCFVPKKCVHRFQASSKGIHRIRMFPRTGHLLLSAGLDGKCKVWNVEEKQLMRTYCGHTAGVRDVQFNNDGTRFVSCSYDRYLRLWNTETGEALQTLTNRKVPYVVKFYPLDDNFFVVGCSDNKIVTYDCTTGEITQEYNHHLAPVNAIVFTEDHGIKMVTTSDDKKVLVWEWDIGVPIKYISDPTMHSMPCMTMHPSFQYFCAQSLDNHIAVFQATGKFALQRKKKFTGHTVAGYACEMAISPDGQYLASGDGNGRLFFWDWKRTKQLQKYRAHDNGPTICAAWHPLDPSKVFTCGWDGVIKMWE